MTRNVNRTRKSIKNVIWKKIIAYVCGQSELEGWQDSYQGQNYYHKFRQKMLRMFYVAGNLHLKIIRIGARATTVTRTRIQIRGVKGRITAKY